MILLKNISSNNGPYHKRSEPNNNKVYIYLGSEPNNNNNHWRHVKAMLLNDNK
jgi:hypothetical protein